jgi:hypothetical protein
MRKFLIIISWFVALLWVAASCNESKTMQEYLREEKKAIERFIGNNDFVVLKNYPADGVFKENEYFRTQDGLYIHVVDSGNGNRVKSREEVTVRFEFMEQIKTNDTIMWNDTGNKTDPDYPYSFIYDIYQSYSGGRVCYGWVYPLSYVGEHAIVDLIVPSSLGSTTASAAFEPYFFKNLKYTSF